jgi:hypothetical protein
VAADGPVVDQDTKYGTHPVEEDDLAECSLEQSGAESEMDQQQAQYIPIVVEARSLQQ